MSDDNVAEAILGVGLALVATFCSSLANILIRYTHQKNELAETEDQLPAYKRPMWYLIIVLYVLNGVLDFTAFAFAPLSLIAPTSAITIVINAVLAYFFFGEKLNTYNIWGTFFIILGAGCAIWSGSHQAADRDLDELIALYRRAPFVAFLIADVALVIFSTFIVQYLDPRYVSKRAAIHNVFPCLFKNESVFIGLRDPRDTGAASRAGGGGDVSMDDVIIEGIEPRSTGDDGLIANERSVAETASMLRVNSNPGAVDDGNGLVSLGGARTSGDESLGGGGSGADLRGLGRVASGGISPVNHGDDDSHDDDGVEMATTKKKKDGSLSPRSAATSVRHQARSRVRSRAPTSRSSSGMDGDASFLINCRPVEDTWAMGGIRRTGGVALIMRGSAYAFIAGSITSWTNIFGKSTTELIKASIVGENQFDKFVTYIIVTFVFICAFGQLKLMAIMMSTFEAVFIIPIFQCMFIILLILFGSMYFDEFNDMPSWKVGTFCLSIAVAIFGMYLTAKREVVDMEHEMQKKKHYAKKSRHEERRRQRAADAASLSGSAPRISSGTLTRD